MHSKINGIQFSFEYDKEKGLKNKSYKREEERSQLWIDSNTKMKKIQLLKKEMIF